MLIRRIPDRFFASSSRYEAREEYKEAIQRTLVQLSSLANFASKDTFFGDYVALRTNYELYYLLKYWLTAELEIRGLSYLVQVKKPASKRELLELKQKTMDKLLKIPPLESELVNRLNQSRLYLVNQIGLENYPS